MIQIFNLSLWRHVTISDASAASIADSFFQHTPLNIPKVDDLVLGKVAASDVGLWKVPGPKGPSASSL